MKQQYKWHRILSLILTVAVLAAGAAILPVRAAETEWSANAEGIWEIDSIEDLQAFSTACAGNTNGLDYFKGKTVRLMCDLDLNPGWDAATKTAPDNVWTPAATFKGTFDGQGHTISGLYVNRETGGSAFIVKADGATVKNLRLANSYIRSTSKDYVGSICSSATNGAVLEDLWSDAIVEGIKADGTYINYVGGILGGVYNPGTGTMNITLNRVQFEGTVAGNSFVGGLVGALYNASTGQTNLTLTNSVFSGTVNGTTYVGGLIGCLVNAENAEGTGTATVTNSVSWGSVTSAKIAGGLIGGTTHRNRAVVMEDCANYGAVTSTDYKESGGLLGGWKGDATLSRCLNAGTVKDKSNLSGALMYLENKDKTNKSSIILNDCFYVTGTRADGVIAWHSCYDLTVTYNGKTVGTVDASTNTGSKHTHNDLTQTVDSASALLTTPAFSGWGAMGDRVVPESVLRMLCAVPMEIGYVQEPTGAAGETTALRLIGKVMLDEAELADWQSIGFDLLVTRQADGKTLTGSVSGTTVFGSILADEDGQLTAYSAETLGAAFLAALTVKGIPTDGTYTVAVRPFAVRADGTRVTNISTTLTVTGGMLAK